MVDISRYIDCDKCYHGRVCAFRHHYHDMITECNHYAPTADVVEVRHGYWYFIEYEYFCCSECGESYYNGCEYTAQAEECLRNGKHYNYCPHCGAKMDGERREQ